MALGIALTLAAAFLNGYNDSGNVVATIVSTGAMTARRALLLAAVAELVGPFLFGTAVAAAVGTGIVAPASISTRVVAVAVLTVNLWSLGAWYLGLPSSASHALVGSLVGAATAAVGAGVVRPAGLAVILLALLVAPIVGFVGGYGLLKLTMYLAAGTTPRVNRLFRQGQIAASTALAVSHGTNNVQKWMGVMALLLVAGGILSEFVVPFWAVLASGTSFALGTAVGGWRIMRTLGMRLYRIRPVHGFAAQASATGVILSAALLGGPVSTTHVVGSAIMGAGAADRISKVRWGVAGSILATWVLTLPGSALLAGALYLGLARLLHVI